MATRPNINDHTVTGNLAADPRKIDREDGSYLVVLAVAENRSYWDADAQQRVSLDPVYYNVALDSRERSLGNLPSNVLASLHKGDLVTVTGNYQATPFQNEQTGELGINHRIWARDVGASMKFATVEISDNPKPARTADIGWDQGLGAEQSRGQSVGQSPAQQQNGAQPQAQQLPPQPAPQFDNTQAYAGPAH